MLKPSRINSPSLLIRQIAQICQISLEFPGNLPDGKRFRAVGRPLPETAVTQKIFAVKQKLFKACASNVDQPKFGLRRGRDARRR